jgi:hypothetical protein
VGEGGGVVDMAGTGYCRNRNWKIENGKWEEKRREMRGD